MPLRPSLPCQRWVTTALVSAAFTVPITTAAQSRAPGPCDILAARTPCVEAISTTRALYRDYRGPLYQVLRDSDRTTHNIGLLPDGYVNAAEQDEVCAHSTCAILRLYDQSPNHNDLTPAPPGGNASGPGPRGFDVPARAKVLPITIANHKGYGIEVNPGTGYRNDRTRNVAVGSEPEGVYMVTSALHLNSKCCFDFGNAETTNNDDKAGTMDALNIRERNSGQGATTNLDLEDGLFGGLNVPAGTPFVTVMGTNDGNSAYALYQGNAQFGALTSTGALPLRPPRSPMRKEGGIILGIGGDNSNRASGYFFEGVITRGVPGRDALDAIQANIVAARYEGQLRP